MSGVTHTPRHSNARARGKGRMFAALGTLAHLVGVAIVLAISVSEQGWGSGGFTARGVAVLTVFVAVPLALGVIGAVSRGTLAAASRWGACALALLVGAFLGVTGVVFVPAAALFVAAALTGTSRYR